jgi:hypothetical protein
MDNLNLLIGSCIHIGLFYLDGLKLKNMVFSPDISAGSQNKQ